MRDADPGPITASSLVSGIELPDKTDAAASGRATDVSPGRVRGGRARSPLRVGIADDHAIVREGVKDVLSGLADIKVVGEACDGRQAVELARRVEMDVLLMDIAMPHRGGLDALGSLRAQFPGVSVLIVSGFPEEQFALALIRLGAAGYLCKDTAPQELIDAIRVVGAGKRYWSVKVASMLVSHVVDQRPPQLHDALSTREFQIFLRLARGERVGDVGRNLALSHKTVSTYRTSLLRKLALASNSDLTYYAMKHGLMA